jgi:hypothetical protein
VQHLAATLAPRAHEQIMALVQELRERMAGIDRERSEHRKNFLAEIALRPGGAFRVEIGHVVHPNAVLGQRGRDVVLPKCVFRGDQLPRGALDGVKELGGTQAIGPHVARFAFDLLLDPGDANLEKFVEISAEDGEELHPLDQRLRRVLRFLENAPIEFEPTQLAIDEIFRRGKARMLTVLRRVRERDNFRRLFRRRRFRFRLHPSPASSYSPNPNFWKKPRFSCFAPTTAGGQHSTISSARKRKRVSRANLKSSRRFFAI